MAQQAPLRWQVTSSSSSIRPVIDEWLPVVRDLGIPVVALLVLGLLARSALGILRENLAAMRQASARQDQAAKELMAALRAFSGPGTQAKTARGSPPHRGREKEEAAE